MRKRKDINKRKWKGRLKRDLCWNCNKPLEKLLTVYGSKCPQCGFIYSETILNAYKNREKIID